MSHNNFKKFIIITVFLVILYIAATLLMYGSTFSILSDDHKIWAEFGTYFSGLVTPIISFFSFLALIMTIYIQKIMIDKQQEHFESLYKMQYESNEKIHEQINFEKIKSKKDELLKVAERAIESTEIGKETASNLSNLLEDELKLSLDLSLITDRKKLVLFEIEQVQNIAKRNHIIKRYLGVIQTVLSFKGNDLDELEEIFCEKMKEITNDEIEINS